MSDALSADRMVASEDHWIPLSDLMTGLMVMFLLIAVCYMVQVEADAERIKTVAVAYTDTRDALYEALRKEFSPDLPRWHAQLLKEDLTLRFSEPEILFAEGSSDLKPAFKQILDDFFPRYVRILTSPKFRSVISEVRIEGHTSSDWFRIRSADDAYLHNMELSQARTRSTLLYVLALPRVRGDVDWLRRLVTANGLSSSRPILDASGHEDAARSRRVEFKIRTDAETRIAKILEVAR
ncbi:MAG TPA: OmpA family protein [Steroidobacteraceae bacterium]|jgi:outer membrane protein OmpA-like peptidoglycan-associated protein